MITGFWFPPASLREKGKGKSEDVSRLRGQRKLEMGVCSEGIGPRNLAMGKEQMKGSDGRLA